MKRFVLAVLFGCATVSASLADVCVEGAHLDMPDHQVLARAGLSVIVAARHHPARVDVDALTVAERAATLDVVFGDEFGDEPSMVQDLRRLGVFIEHFNLNSSRGPSMSVVFSEPGYVLALLPTLRAYDVPSGVTALEKIRDAFWFFETKRADQLLTQLMWNSLIGATIDEAMDDAPILLDTARAQVDAAIARMEAEDASVAAVMQDMRLTTHDSDRRWYLESQLETCLIFDESSDRPINWDEIPQPQRDLLVLTLLEYQFDYLPELFDRSGWLLDDALRVMHEQGLTHHADALRQGLALFPEGMARDSDAWRDLVWEQAAQFENILHFALYQPLREGQDPQFEVSFDTPLWGAFDALAKQSPLWP